MGDFLHIICNMRDIIQRVQVIEIILDFDYARTDDTIDHSRRQPRVSGQSGGVILLNAMLNRYSSSPSGRRHIVTAVIYANDIINETPERRRPFIA